MVAMTGLYRPTEGRVVAGACLAVANRFRVGVVSIRVLTALGVVLFGLSIWIYIGLWILIPGEPD